MASLVFLSLVFGNIKPATQHNIRRRRNKVMKLQSKESRFEDSIFSKTREYSFFAEGERSKGKFSSIKKTASALKRRQKRKSEEGDYDFLRLNSLSVSLTLLRSGEQKGKE